MDIVRELRHAARRLARTPSFTLISLTTLSLAIGATTAVFSLVNGVLLQPLDFARPDRLVYLHDFSSTDENRAISPRDLLDYRTQTHSFTDVVAIEGDLSLSLVRPSAPALRLSAARVGATFFSILGVKAQLGRTFVAGEDVGNAPKVVVLSDGAWKHYFAGDSGVVGRPITLNDAVYTVIGVAPHFLTYPGNPELWYPAVWSNARLSDAGRDVHSVYGIARLRDGVTLSAANRDLALVAHRIASDFPKADAGVGATAVPLRTHILGDTERSLWAMFGAVAFVLLIACANVANLLLVRATSRASEVALRTALGADRIQLVRQFLTESALLAFTSAALGTVMATLAVHAAVTSTVMGVPRLQDVTIDVRVLGFAVVLAVGSGLAFGVVPAVSASGWDVGRLLRSGTRGATPGRAGTRSVLVLAELALGTVLLVGAGLLIRSFERLTHVDPGFRPDHLVVFDADLSSKKYNDDATVNAFTDEVVGQLSAIPGVRNVAVAANRPFDPEPLFAGSTDFAIDGAPTPAPGTAPESRVLPVSPSFFQTMGLTLERGRGFTESDNRPDAAPVLVITEALARRYFPGQDPIGKRLTFNFGAHPRGEIVGIVRDVRFDSVTTTPEPATFFPFHHVPVGATFLVRTAVDPASLVNDVRRVVAAADPSVPAYEIGTMNDAMGASLARWRFYTALLTGFAAVALLLATLGVYGTISYAVSQETRDFGIRIALGARSRDVRQLVISRGVSLIVPGLAVGILGALFLTRLISGLLFGVEPLDPLTFTCVCLAFAVVGGIASWIPARRAARVDPIIAMRSE
ncbi:MAG TPA: ABC transporter permease [Gemmatimonadaceae bacterium]|nr:ABC transporter permease [Gemmatimonadaceae bacterium]